MLIVNADDLAMTPGANAGIFDGFDNGVITHASIMANCDYFKEAIDGVNSRENFNVGMHLNITYGKALCASNLTCDGNGVFNLGYLDLLRRKDKDFLEQVYKEWDRQIELTLDNLNSKKLTHIDSHRHVHLIPHLYPLVVRLAKKYNIPRIRLINESLIGSLFLTKKFNFILNGGIIKYMLLRGFSIIDRRYKDLYKDIEFYSILYTGVANKNILQKLKDSPKVYEIMVHPSHINLDKDIKFYDEDEKDYRVSKNREFELDSVLSISKVESIR